MLEEELVEVVQLMVGLAQAVAGLSNLLLDRFQLCIPHSDLLLGCVKLQLLCLRNERTLSGNVHIQPTGTTKPRSREHQLLTRPLSL